MHDHPYSQFVEELTNDHVDNQHSISLDLESNNPLHIMDNGLIKDINHYSRKF